MTLVDAVGREHTRVAPARDGVRIVSLVPSITELLFDLGLAPWIVGRTGFCVHPKDAVSAVPKVGGTKDVNIGKIRKLAPTHLVVNIDENEKPTVEALAEFVPHVIVTHPLAPRDNLPLYRLLGAVFGAEERAEALCARFEEEYAALRAAARNGRARRVLYCIWQDPWMTVSRDTYIARMLAEVRWEQAVVADPRRYPSFAWSERLLADVDEVLLSSEPYRFTEAHADALERQIGKPVQLLDGEMVSWYGSRAILGLRYMRELISRG
ncbi:MAG TPA: helical backbone metal receptor [Paucimonas sp.]|nr:helical backbone metal receptor [Paucimonas sp.]